MKNLLIGSLFLLAIWSCTNSQKDKNKLDGSFNDTLAVRKLLVKEIRKGIESNPAIDSIHEFSNGINRWEIWYRFDKEFWRGQSIELKFGDINGDGLNDAIAHIEYDEGGNNPWKDNTEVYVERTTDGYKVKDKLPLFGYRYVQSGSIKDGLIELRGIDWANGDPVCCPSIKDEFKIKLVVGKFEKVNENSDENSINSLTKSNGETEQRDTVSAENKADENPLTQYKQSLPPSEGYIAVLNNDGKWGYVYEDGKVLIECQYEGVSSFKNGKAVVKIASDVDWQTKYRYIDANGNDLGLFFSQIDGTSCDEATVAISDILVQTDFLRNCSDGVMSVYYQGDEGSGGETFYPNINIEQLIAKLARTDTEFGPVYKKFDGNSLEFKDGDFNIYITVNKNSEGIVTSINFSRNYHSMGSHKIFTPKGTGVMVSEGSGA